MQNAPRLLTLSFRGASQELQQRHLAWIDSTSQNYKLCHDAIWSKSIAVSGEELVDKVKLQFGIKAKDSNTNNVDGVFLIKEPDVSYTTLVARAIHRIDVVNKNQNVLFCLTR